MSDDSSIREISVDFARTIAQELKAGDGYVRVSTVFGGHVEHVTQRGEDMIERYIRRAIQRDRERR